MIAFFVGLNLPRVLVMFYDSPHSDGSNTKRRSQVSMSPPDSVGAAVTPVV